MLSNKVFNKASRPQAVKRGSLQVANGIRDGQTLDRPLRVAVIGGGPSGACAAETLAAGGIETYLIERKLDNCKVRRMLVYRIILQLQAAKTHDARSYPWVDFSDRLVFSLSLAEELFPFAWLMSSSFLWRSSIAGSPR